MNTKEFNVIAMNAKHLKEVNGGFFFLIPLLIGLAANTTCAAIVAGPLAGAAKKGWDDKE